MWLTWGNVGPDYKNDDMASVKQACSLLSEIMRAVTMAVAVIVDAIGQMSGGRRGQHGQGSMRDQAHSDNYSRVRGFNQTKGHWNNTGGPMSGRTHERYRHGK